MFKYLFTEARKAVAAFATAAAGAAVTAFRAAIDASSDGGSSITQSEWITIAGSAVVLGVIAGFAVFQTRNVPSTS
jgi:hypothetical protein